MSEIKNVLAQRYASKEMKDIFNEEGKILTEREFWISILLAQKELGMDIPQEAIDAYKKVKNIINLEEIHEKEKKLRHDVKARIESFCELAKFEHIHKGMTSRDLTDNVEQYQILKAMQLIRVKVIKTLELFSLKSKEYSSVVMTGRTHNVPAQPTTVGKRMAMFGEEIVIALENFNFIIDHYPLRGLKGAVGTLLDQFTLFNNNAEKAVKLEKIVANHLGFKNILNATGQVYPRSLDYMVVSSIVQLSAGASSFCKTLRLMAGYELVSEGFQKEQVGSSAMPHKMNSRNCERVNGLALILKGYLAMVAELSGDQWNEGDVSCSVVRRVAIPDTFFAIDGLFETLMTILKEMVFFKPVINNELEKYLPFLSTTTILMEAVKQGMGREAAHEIIKKHAVQTAIDLREGLSIKNNFLERLSEDKDFNLSLTQLKSILDEPIKFTGIAETQIHVFCDQVNKWLIQFPEAKLIEPHKII